MKPWVYQGQETLNVPTGYTNFVYLITHIETGKFYVGKKQFYSERSKPPLKGKVRRRRSVQESNWRSYYGSCVELSADVLGYGEDAFTREIIHLCKSKSEASYLEAKEQFDRDVLFRKDSYNGNICVKVLRSHFRR